MFSSCSPCPLIKATEEESPRAVKGIPNEEGIPVAELIPACGQGTLAAEIKEGRGDVLEILARAEDKDTRLASRLERLTLEHLGGGCLEALGIYAVTQAQGWAVHVFHPAVKKKIDLPAIGAEEALKLSLTQFFGQKST